MSSEHPVIGRRDLLKTMVWAGTSRGFAGPGIEARLSRFMMKGDFPRLEVIAPAYRFVWHGRLFAFRLVSTVIDSYDERVSYSNFGPFAVGGVDLLCNHYYAPVLAWPGGEEIRFGGARLSHPGAAGLQTDRALSFMLEHWDVKGRSLRIFVTFSAEPPLLLFRFEPSGFAGESPMLLSWTANFIYDRIRRGSVSVAYYSSGARTGLRVSGPEPDCVSITDASFGKTITCRLPSNRPSEWTLSILGPKDRLAEDRTLPPRITLPPATSFQSVPLVEPKSWEADTMDRRGWKPDREPAKERIAGIFVAARDWRHPVSWVPEATMEYVSKTMLPRVFKAGCFGAVGLSRDGVTEKGENEAWLDLVAQVHRAGLRVYMKPGDGEITAMRGRGDIEAWAKACFGMPAGRCCDVVRLPWEAVLVPWTTANLCLAPRFHTQALASLTGLPWRKAQEKIVSSVADRFSFIIDAIRRHAPAIIIDVESADAAVMAKLLARHDNLGIMYMTYGQYPRAAEYLDLYYCVARKQFDAARVVLETDCYYTGSITSLGQLKGRPYSEMYSADDIALMRRKHRHMCNLRCDAAWSWGVNITYTDDKFRAICEAGRG